MVSSYLEKILCDQKESQRSFCRTTSRITSRRSWSSKTTPTSSICVSTRVSVGYPQLSDVSVHKKSHCDGGCPLASILGSLRLYRVSACLADSLAKDKMRVFCVFRT